MTWFSILKETRQIASTGIRTKLGNTPLTMGDRDDEECCWNAFNDFYDLMEAVRKGDGWNYQEWNEEGVKYTSHDLMVYAKGIIQHIFTSAYLKPGFLEKDSDMFCDELEQLMGDAQEYYRIIVVDGSEKGNWSDAVSEAWIVHDKIVEIFSKWDDCEEEVEYNE